MCNLPVACSLCVCQSGAGSFHAADVLLVVAGRRHGVGRGRVVDSSPQVAPLTAVDRLHRLIRLLQQLLLVVVTRLAPPGESTPEYSAIALPDDTRDARVV